MGNQFPLDTPGVQAKVSEIYAKPSNEQAAIRADIRTDFGGWLKESFLLTTDQETYLDHMDPAALADAGEQAAEALERQDDILYVESTPAVTALRDRKGKELMMGRAQMNRIAPTDTGRELFLIVVNYYGDLPS